VKIFTLGKSTFDSDLAEREALIEFNRQREKTNGQIVKEAEELLKVKRQKNKSTQGERTDLSSNLKKSSSSDSWEEVND
jgi:hypothetical protein